MSKPFIRTVQTVDDAEERARLIGVRAERNSGAATLMEQQFHSDVLYSIAHGLADNPQAIAKVAFDTWRQQFPRIAPK